VAALGAGGGDAGGEGLGAGGQRSWGAGAAALGQEAGGAGAGGACGSRELEVEEDKGK
jgi:hypothetical protein